MDKKSKIFKRKSGKSKGKWILRIEYFDEILGKEKIVERIFGKRSDAVDKRDTFVTDLEKTQGQILKGERMTFKELADICERVIYKPAKIVEGRKVSGVRSIETAKAQLSVLRRFFGLRLIRRLTTESLTEYKLWRLSEDSERTGNKIKLATVNRELSSLRRMMRYAYGKGWIVKDIFFNAKVIEVSAEIERTRLLTLDEEKRLLENCQGEREITYKRKKRTNPDEIQEITATISVDNPHLKAMIIMALDSGMRRGEIFKLRWQDIDFDNNLIKVVGTHTKTQRERIAPLSERAKAELKRIRKFTPGEKPFPFTDIKRSFATAKKLAKINDLHFHDLRRTAITRWIQQGISLAFAGKFAGHSQLQTTMKHYTATDSDMIQEINEKMNSFHSQNETEPQIESKMMN